MITQCSSLGHFHTSSVNRFALTEVRSTTNANRISLTSNCSENGQLLFCRLVVSTLRREKDCARNISPCKFHSLQSTIHFFRRRKSNMLKSKSGSGTERIAAEDHNSGPEKVENTTKKVTSDESIVESQSRIRRRVEKLDNKSPSDSWVPGKLFGEREETGQEANPADSLTSKAEFSREHKAEERDSEENSIVNSVSEESSLESEHPEWGAGGGYDITDDLEPLLDEVEGVEYVTRIMVPRQRYIRSPKAELVQSLSLLSSQHEAKLSSMCNFLELILHAKHKFVLEELRADYGATQSTSDRDSSDWTTDNSATTANPARKTTSSRRPSIDLSSLSTGEEAQRPCCDSPEHAQVVNKPTKTDSAPGEDKLPRWKAWGMNFLNAVKQGRGTDLDNDNGGDFETGSSIHEEARRASTERFQKNFLKLLRSAQFEGLSAQDLELTAALNSDYLLTLPIAVDWKRASKSNAIIYRRGYAKEEQKGLLLGAKFDYLQSAFLREMLKGLTGPLISAGHWFMQKWKSLRNDPEGRVLAETLERWVEEPLQPDENSSQYTSEETAKEEDMMSMESEMDLPIWKAAQQAVPRYEAVLSSAGSRGLLLRRILVSMGILPSDSTPATLSVDEDSSALEPHLRPNFLSRVSMKDIWLAASKAAIGENAWRRFRAAFSVFFTRVTLQEPAFQELVLLYSDDDQERSEASSLQLQMYKTIPLPDLKIVFPSKKLTFRLIDTVRLDLTTFVGLTAFLYNYHFEGFLSSPSAFTLDLIAASALLVFVTRAALGYKQTWDRYQLLVNKTLYEKTLANGFGVVHFLMDASEEQQFKEAIVAFSILSGAGTDEGMSREQLADACERFLYYRFNEQTQMPVDNAIKTLLDLGLVYIRNNVSSSPQCESEVRYRALTYDEGLEALKQYWEVIPSKISSPITM